MVPVATTEGGSAVATPDTCLTPPYSTPSVFTNTATLSSATGTSTKVFVRMMPVVVLTSTVPSTSGDESGTYGGVTSGTFMQKASFNAGSSKVYAGGQAVVYLGTATTQNSTNAVGTLSAVTQSVVYVAP